MSGEQAYQNAMRRRAELRQELQEIETFLRLYEKFAGPEGAATHALEPQDHPETISGMKLIPHIRTAILDAGRPLSRGGVVKALSSQGLKVGGQGPAQSIATLMSRAKSDFVNLKPHGYWPRDVAYAAASYHPAQDNEPKDEDRQENGWDATAEAEKRESDEGDLWSGERSAA